MALLAHKRTAAGDASTSLRVTRPRLTAAMDTAMTEAQAQQRAGDLQLVQTKRTVGGKYKPDHPARLTKLLKASLQNVVQRYQWLSDWLSTNTNGRVPLTFIKTTGAGVPTVYPVYAFDLTSVANKENTGNEVVYPAVLYRLARLNGGTSTDLAQAYYWVPYNGALDQAASNPAYTWLNEKMPRSNVFPQQAVHFDWADIRLMIYGAKAFPTTVEVSIVQFDSEYCPNYYTCKSSDGTVSAPTVDEEVPYAGSEDRARQYNEFYAGFVDRFISHPLNKRDAHNVRGYRVLHREVVKLNPSQTTDRDTRGYMRMMRIFYNMHRNVKLQWERLISMSDAGTGQSGGGVAVTNENNPNVWDANNPIPHSGGVNTKTECQVAPDPRARIFLLVTATAPEGAFAVDNNGSFDFCIRRKHTVVGNT